MAEARESVQPGLPESVGYALKRVFLGRPLITEQLRNEQLSKKVALGVLSPDAISSSAYGPEEMLLALLPYAGAAAFTLVLPITGAVLVILVLVAASYRQVVTVYTRAGGSYAVARDNFGPKIAQIAAAALLIDYVVTVAVQASAGTVAVVSALPEFGPYSLEITIGVVVILCLANLRGLREAGGPFALPTYLFSVLVGLVIIIGVIKHFTVGLPVYDPAHLPGTVAVHHGSGLVEGATVLVLLRSFANGGSSLTGVEAISNTVSALRTPQGRNARTVLTVMACTLGFLVAGVSLLAHFTHATPYLAGYPSVLSQETRAVFGHGTVGHVLYALVQAASALILYTGANTSFNGFPFLASFVAEDRFLPRQLTKRGHRLVFSNGIIVLTVLAVALLAATGGTVNALVPFYAIGVFTGFAMAGYGMTRHHLAHREPGWRRRLAVNCSAGVLSTLVVLIFAIAKFTEGAWLIVVVFPLLVAVLIRVNREYREEAAILNEVRGNPVEQATYSYHHVYVLVNNVDLAMLEALRYAHTLRLTGVEAVHFMLDAAHAQHLRTRWDDLGIAVPLKIVDCPDRRLVHAAAQFILEAGEGRENTEVTVLLPRRSYAPLLGRLLHDRTADRLAHVINRIPHTVATIVPYDVQARIRQRFPRLPEERLARGYENLRDRLAGPPPASLTEHNAPRPEPDATTIAAVEPGRRVTVDGRLHSITDEERGDHRVLLGTLTDSTGSLTLEFHDAHPDLAAGQLLRLTGHANRRDRSLIISDPDYRIIDTPGEESGPSAGNDAT
ncbi:amino acid permease [Streptomyces sp. NTH33]|uniref:amino acid permease n=1 Tax=Streptomyces sp. NTH33 TaxID=1735453 RepID=UPI0026D84170|nr:amino acid permease [Streptomyces sp. NTH33]